MHHLYNVEDFSEPARPSKNLPKELHHLYNVEDFSGVKFFVLHNKQRSKDVIDSEIDEIVKPSGMSKTA